MAEEEFISKTQVKKAMNELQDLGLRLTHFASDTLQAAQVPNHLIVAIEQYRKLPLGGAMKRQGQYIGRLMRELEDEEVLRIRDYLAKIDGDNIEHNAAMQRLEKLRTQLLEDDDALTVYLSSHSEADGTHLRQLIRNARREVQNNQPPKSARALFRYLRELAQV